MAEVDDPDDHCGGTTEEDVAVTAAKVLMSFKNDRLPSAAPPPPLDWGSKGKRSRTITMAGTLEAKSEEEEEAAVTKANGKMRASPPSPLDYRGGSGASTSGGENGPSSPEELPAAKWSRIGEPLAVRGDNRRPTKVVGSERPPLVSIVARKSIKPSGKKKGIPELQAMEKALLEQREKLRKEVEAQRKNHEALSEQNRRLKIHRWIAQRLLHDLRERMNGKVRSSLSCAGRDSMGDVAKEDQPFFRVKDTTRSRLTVPIGKDDVQKIKKNVGPRVYVHQTHFVNRLAPNRRLTRHHEKKVKAAKVKDTMGGPYFALKDRMFRLIR